MYRRGGLKKIPRSFGYSLLVAPILFQVLAGAVRPSQASMTQAAVQALETSEPILTVPSPSSRATETATANFLLTGLAVKLAPLQAGLVDRKMIDSSLLGAEQWQIASGSLGNVVGFWDGESTSRRWSCQSCDSTLAGISWEGQSAYALSAISESQLATPKLATVRSALLDEQGALKSWAHNLHVVVRQEKANLQFSAAELTKNDLEPQQGDLVDTQPLYKSGEEATMKVFKRGFTIPTSRLAEGLDSDAPIVVQKTEVKPPPGPTVDLLRVSENFTQAGRALEVLHFIPNQTFRPGRYTIATTYTDGQTTATEESSFLWGVAAVNVRQSVVAPDTTTDVHMAVLDDYGRTVCDSTVTLAVTNPDGAVQEFSTKSGSIIRNPNCRDRSVTNDPDYKAAYTTTIPGTYTMTMTATTKDGPRTITDTFAVTEPIPVTVERTEFPTRIYPPAVYPVTFQVTPLQDMKGKAIETVPIGFELSSISDNGAAPDPAPDASVRTIEWNVDWQAGQTYTLKYTFDAPNISPLLFRLGPLSIIHDDGSAVFTEARQWLIASDATKTWDGGGTTSAWSEGANWSDNAEPVDGDDIVFDGTSNDDSDWDTTSVATSIASITASSMSGSLTVNQITTTITGAFSHTSTGNVTINQSLSVGGAFTLTTSGTLSMGSRALTMTGVGVNINTNKTLYNLTINPSSTGTVTVVTNDFTVSNTLTVSASDTLSIGSGRIVTLSRATSTALTLSGTISGSGTLYYSTTTAFPTAGTMSANLRMDATGGNLILSNRTYGGNVELYSNSSSAARTVTAGTAGSQTLTFSGNLTMNAANTQNLTLQGATWDPTVIVTGLFDFTGAGSGTEVVTAPDAAATWTVTGAVDLADGTWTASAETLKMNGTANLGGGGNTVNHLTIDGSGNTATLTGTDLTVSGTLTIGGAADGNNDTLTIASGRTLTLSKTGATALTINNSGTDTINGPGTLIYRSSTDFPTVGTLGAVLILRFDMVTNSMNMPARTDYGAVTVFNSSASVRTLTILGAVTLSGDMDIQTTGDGSATITGATNNPLVIMHSLACSGAGAGAKALVTGNSVWQFTGSLDFTNCTPTITAGNTVSMIGTGTLTSNGNVLQELDIDSSGTVTLAAAVHTVATTLYLGGSGTPVVAGSTIAMTGSGQSIIGGDKTINNLTLDGNGTIDLGLSDITIAGTLNVTTNDTLSILTGRTLTHTGGTFTFPDTATISGAGTLTFTNTSPGPGTTGTLSSGVRFDATNGNITMPARTYGGAVTVTNTGTTTGRTVTAGSGTLVFSSTLNLTNTSSGTAVLELNTNDPTTTITGALTIGSSTTFSANSANALNVNGNYTNNGTFTHNSGTVTVAGSSQQTFGGTMTTTSAFNALTITNASGSDPDSSPSVIFSTAATTDGTFTAATANTKIRFGATLVYTLTNIVFNGQATGTRVYLRSSSGGSAWLLTASGTRSISNTNVKDSNATGSGTAIDASNGTNVDGTGNTNWTFASTITISGTCDQFDQTTDCTDDGSNAITVVVNGASVGTDATVDGAWSVGSVAQPSVGDVITVFIDGNADSNEAVAVTVYSGSGNVAGIKLFQRHLVIGSDRDSTVTNTNIASCDNDNGTACSGDEDVFINVTAGDDLTVDALGSYSDEELYIDSGDTFRPASAGGADVTTVSVENVGTWTADANAINVAGDWLNSGTFTANTSTVTFTATSTGKTINAGSSSFNAVTFNGSGGAWSPLTNTMTIGGDLLVIAGTFNTAAGTASVVANGNVQCSGTCGTIDMTSAGTNTFTQSVSADKSFGTNVAVATDWTFYNLTFTGTSGVRTITTNTTGTGEINVTNDLTLSNSGTSLALDNNTNDRILDVDNDVTIGSGTTLSASSSASFTVGGSWTNSGTFTHNNGTITLDSVAATETINPGGSSFYNVTVNNGLVGYWKLDEGTGTSSVVDSSGYGTTGTMTNLDSADWVSAGTSTHYGSNPGALNFDSSGSEYIDLGNPDQLNTGFTNKMTLAAWIKPTSGTGQVIIGKPHSSNSATSPYFKWILYKTSLNRLHMRIDSAFADGNSGEIVDGTWQHVAGTYDGSLGSANIKLFVNGNASLTANKTGNIQSSSINVGIGAGLFTPPNGYFNGAIDDVRVYNRALSSSEISSLGSGTHPTSTTYTLQAALTVTNAFTMRTGKLDVSATNCSGSPCAVTMSGNYTNVAGLDPRTGTTTFDAGATGKTIQADMPFYNLTFANASGGWTLDKQRLEADNTLTLTNGTLDVSASSCNGGGSCGVTVGANWDNDAAFTARTGTVTFDDTAGTDTIDADGTGADSFYNMTFNDAGGSATWQMTNAMDVDNNFTITGGTFDFNGSNQLNVGGNFSNSDTVTKSTGTLVMDATSGTKTIDQTGAVNGTLHNLTFNDGGGPAVFQAGSAVDVDNDLTISGGEFQAGAVKTYYLTSSTTNAVTNNRRLNTTDPAGTASDTATCDDADVDQSDKYCVIYPTTTDQTWSASLPSTIQQRGYMTDSTQPLTGTFASGTWTAAVTTSVSEWHYVYTGYEICGRLWKADTTLGSATAITNWTCQSVTSALTDSTITFSSVPSVTLTNEVVTAEFAAHFIGPATENDVEPSYMTFRVNQGGARQKITTPVFTNPISVGNNWLNSDLFTAGTGTVTFDATDTGNTINPGSSSFYNVTFNGSGGAWSPLTNTLTATNDLTMTAGTFNTAAGTASVTVNGTVQCGVTCGTINMTSAGTNTFTQSVAAAENFGTNVAVATDWSFYNLAFASTTGSPTITVNGTGTGEINVTNNLTTSTSGTALTVDDNTNDRIFDVDNDVTIGANTTVSASSSASFTVGGSWTNSGTFTHNNGTVVFDSIQTTETITSGGSTFGNVEFDSGLVGYWKLDEGTGTSSVADASRYGQAGTMVNHEAGDWNSSVESAANFGNDPYALDFDGTATGGSEEYINLGTPNQLNSDLTTQLSLVANIRPQATAKLEVIIGKPHNDAKSAPYYKWLLYRTSNNALSCRIGDQYKDSVASTLTNNSWSAVGCVYDSSNITVYHQGSSVGTQPQSDAIESSSTPAAIGAGTGTTITEEFTGRIDDVRIYKRALSGTEMTALHNGNHPATSTFTLQDALDVDINLGVRTGELDVSATNCSSNPCSLTVGGNYVNVANLNARTGTVTLDSSDAANIQADEAFSSLTVSNGGTRTLDKQRLDVDSALTLSGGTLDVSAASCAGGTSCGVNVGGNYTNSATFTARSGTVTFDGASQQTASGAMTSGSAFSNLTITNSSGSVTACETAFTPSVALDAAATATGTFTATTANTKIRYNSGSTYTFTNINWNGQSASTPVVFRNSNLTSGTWLLNVSGTQTAVNAVDVARSDASSGSEIDARKATNTDCGNNTNWRFLDNLTVSISDLSMDLGTLNPNLTGSDSHTLTLTSTAANGYVCRATEDGDLRDASANTIDDVADGIVSTGAEEYGVSCSGGGCQLSGDNAVSGSPLTVASSAGPVTSQATTVTYKASVTTLTRGSHYTQLVTFACTANF